MRLGLSRCRDSRAQTELRVARERFGQKDPRLPDCAKIRADSPFTAMRNRVIKDVYYNVVVTEIYTKSKEIFCYGIERCTGPDLQQGRKNEL